MPILQPTTCSPSAPRGPCEIQFSQAEVPNSLPASYMAIKFSFLAMNPDDTKDLIEKVADLKEADVLSIVTARLRQGDDPLKIIDTCQEGMLEVGRRYEKR